MTGWARSRVRGGPGWSRGGGGGSGGRSGHRPGLGSGAACRRAIRLESGTSFAGCPQVGQLDCCLGFSARQLRTAALASCAVGGRASQEMGFNAAASPASAPQSRSSMNPRPISAIESTHERGLDGTSMRTGLAYGVAALLAVLALVAAGRARAAPDSTMTYPAGTACSFPLQIDITGGPTRSTRPSKAVTEACVSFSAGTGSDLVFTNLSTGATYALKGNGAVSWFRIDQSGSARITLTGHNIVIYFPSDVPAGPSTTLVVGREDIAVDLATFQFTRLARSGKTTDICAALS